MKKGFTLIELLVSTVILFLIVFALTKAYGGLKQGIDVAKRSEAKSREESDLINLLYSDFVQARDINISSGRDYDYVVIGSTRNSLYDAPHSSVAYLVTKPDKKLMRIESPSKITLPIVASDLYRYHYLELGYVVDAFKLYRSKPSKDGCSLMIFIGKQKPLLFEFALLNRNSC